MKQEGKELQTLRRTFLLLVISLTVLLAAALLYIIQDTRSDRIRDLDYTASVIKGYYELSFHQWELSLISIGERMVEIHDDQLRLEYANEALKLYENELLAFGFARPDGKVITFTGRSLNDSLPHLMMSKLTKRSFELALSRDHVSLGESYYFQNVDDWIIPIRVPIRSSKDEIVAVNTSAIRYSSVVSDLERFGFNQNYRIHLINKDFNSTQIFFPLDSGMYRGILGNDTLVYKDQQLDQLSGDHEVVQSYDPLTGEEILCVFSEINPVNHQLVVSVAKSTLISEVIDRFEFVLLTYLLLIFGSRLLYYYLRRNLRETLGSVKEEQANLKAIIESTEDIIGLFDKNFLLMEYNRAFELYSQQTDKITLHKGIDLFPLMKSKRHAVQFRNFISRAFSGEKFSETVTYPGPEGEIIFRFTYNPIFKDGQVIRISLFAEDITDLRKYQRQLEEYNRNLEELVTQRTSELEDKNKQLAEGYEMLKSTQQQLIRAEKMASLGVLSAGIGHEINNPLNFIKHGSEALRMKLEELMSGKTEDLTVYFNAIDEGVKRAADIVDGLSHFSRSGANLDEDCDVHQIINNSLTLLSNQLKKRNIEIVRDLNASDCMIKGNDGKLHQVVTNILSNAEHAISNKGKIFIRTWNEENAVVMEFEDTGMGMTEDVLSKLTDPFFTTKAPGVGTGLGMFITQMIIDEHNAKIEVESEAGKGSIFRIRLFSKSS